ncbi:MAG: GntR family transcriptional regulator [Armatimonadetes bacterium]|nr:GntR family transcriptional regulator [Armatimonadota bacterium]
MATVFPWMDEDDTPVLAADRVAYHEIKRRIVDGRLRPGDRLVLRDLAKEIGVSQVPVVVAIRMLERDGFVANVPGYGSCVRTWGKEEIRDLYQIRACLEGLAARLCAQRATDAEIEAVVAANEAFIRATEANDLEAQIQADLELHVALVRGAHAAELRRMTNNGSIIDCSLRQLGISFSVLQAVRPEVKHTHDAIVEAVARRDPDAAERAGRGHVEESLARNLTWIEEIAQAMTNGQGQSFPKWIQQMGMSKK